MKFYGENPKPILERLPTAHVTQQYDSKYTIEAEVYGNSILDEVGIAMNELGDYFDYNSTLPK